MAYQIKSDICGERFGYGCYHRCIHFPLCVDQYKEERKQMKVMRAIISQVIDKTESINTMDDFKKQIYINSLKVQGVSEEDILKMLLKLDKFICPNCLTDYVPTHKSKEEAFRTNDLEAREQWLSHICSTKCWNEYLGVE